MESTSEVVYDEETKSSVTKKCVQAVSTTMMQQKLSSVSLVAERDVMSIMGSEDSSLIDKQLKSIPNLESSLTLPIISSPSLPEEGISTTSLQSEFTTMKINDDCGNEIGQIVKQKQQQQCVQASSTATSAGSNSKSTASLMEVSSSATSSSKVQQSSKSVICESQKSSSSLSCSSFSSTEKQQIVSTSARSLSSMKSSQSIEKVMSSSTAVVEDQAF